MVSPDVRKFVEKCRDKDVEVYELSGRGWSKTNEFSLHDIYYDGARISIQHNIAGQIYTFDIEAVKQVSFGEQGFSVAIVLNRGGNKNLEPILIHLKK